MRIYTFPRRILIQKRNTVAVCTQFTKQSTREGERRGERNLTIYSNSNTSSNDDVQNSIVKLCFLSLSLRWFHSSFFVMLMFCLDYFALEVPLSLLLSLFSQCVSCFIEFCFLSAAIAVKFWPFVFRILSLSFLGVLVGLCVLCVL